MRKIKENYADKRGKARKVMKANEESEECYDNK